MMERQNGNILPYKATEAGIKGKPPYSVETPYGFRLDLDFLKYVDDIEKGNTIKRVPIHRRNRGPRASTLPRHIHPSGCGYRPSPWGSTGALGPRSQLSDDHQHGWAYDPRSAVSSRGLTSLAEMEARIREFDEQPLGEHIRPHLLRATSLPLTVLLRQGSESTEESGSLRSSRDHLGGRNTSCEDIFHSPGGPRHQDTAGLMRRLTEALERIGELEMEVRVIPDLRAQIHILQEERERLRLGLNPQARPSVNGTGCHYSAADVKRSRHESHGTLPASHSVNGDSGNTTHEWRMSTDLDELLTVTSLQAKVAVLEQKLHEAGLELQRVSGLLRGQQKERSRNGENAEDLTGDPAARLRAGKAAATDQDADETTARPRSPGAVVTARTTTTNEERHQVCLVDRTGKSPPATVEPSDAAAAAGRGDTAVIIQHINKIKRLLDQQWECLRSGSESTEEEKCLQQNAKVTSLQQEMMELVNILASHCAQLGGDKEHEASGFTRKTEERTKMTKNSAAVIEGHTTTSIGGLFEQDGVKENVHGGSEQKESSVCPEEMAAAQVEANPGERGMEGRGQIIADGQMISRGTASGRADGGVAAVQAEDPEKMGKMKPQPAGEQMEDNSGSETSTRGRSLSADEIVNAEFMTACHFLNDHMDNMENPNDDMRKALVDLFENWFGTAAEEASDAGRVSAYLREVKKSTPSLLAFLMNLADDNGNTVLHYSVSHCNYSIVGLLLDTGVCDVNLQNKAGYTTVMLASLTAPDGPAGMEVVRRLMEQGNINIRSSKTGQTALHLAVRHGRVVMVRLLLSCGADANIQDGQGTTALMFASERGYTHVARLLLERSQCDLALADKRGQTALTIATQGSHADTVALLQAHAKARAL